MTPCSKRSTNKQQWTAPGQQRQAASTDVWTIGRRSPGFQVRVKSRAHFLRKYFKWIFLWIHVTMFERNCKKRRKFFKKRTLWQESLLKTRLTMEATPKRTTGIFLIHHCIYVFEDISPPVKRLSTGCPALVRIQLFSFQLGYIPYIPSSHYVITKDTVYVSIKSSVALISQFHFQGHFGRQAPG